MTPSAIIFDLDGTLVDSADDILLALRLSLDHQGIRPPAAMGRRWIGPPVSEILDRSGIAMTESTKQEVVRDFREIYDHSEMGNTVPYPGALALLDRCQKRGIGMYVATNKPLLPTRRLLNRWFPGIFQAVVCVDSVAGSRLSKAAMVSKLIQEQGLDPRETWVIGDGVSDINAAVSCGCTALGISFGYGDPIELLAQGAERIFSSLDELFEEES